MNYINKNEVIKLIDNNEYKYLWVNTYSDIYLKDIHNQKVNFFNDDLDNLIEAKLFNNEKELSIMLGNKEGMFSVVKFNPDEYEDFIEEKQVLNEYKLKHEINKLIIRHYLKYDEDGQAYVAYTKLCRVEGEK